MGKGRTKGIIELEIGGTDIKPGKKKPGPERPSGKRTSRSGDHSWEKETRKRKGTIWVVEGWRKPQKGIKKKSRKRSTKELTKKEKKKTTTNTKKKKQKTPPPPPEKNLWHGKFVKMPTQRDATILAERGVTRISVIE